jgi:single-stranded-DNA-specific exonuclease
MQCDDLLLAHGGHAAAAGLEVERHRFEEFRARFAEVCARMEPAPDIAQVDGDASFGDLDPHTVRRMATLGPFGSGHSAPRFRSRGVKFAGHPTTDARGQDLRVRAVEGGVMLPARIVRGTGRFEEIRRHDGTWTLVYSPRLGARAEDGPVVLDVHDLVAEPASTP